MVTRVMVTLANFMDATSMSKPFFLIISGAITFCYFNKNKARGNFNRVKQFLQN